MKFIDPHCHLWDLSLGYNGWISNQDSELLGSLKPLNKNYLIDDYLKDTSSFQVEKIVHIEAASTLHSSKEVDWLTHYASKHPVLGGIVAGADLLQETIREQLADYATIPLVKGIRQILNWHPKSKYTATNRKDDLTNATWKKNYQLLQQAGLSFDMQICPSQMQDAYQIAKKYPDIAIILNHAGMPIEEECSIWKKGISDLSLCQNVFIKLSGFGMLNHVWTKDSIQMYIDWILESFGTQRCMFASNFPVDKLFKNFSNIMEEYLYTVKKLSPDEQEALFYSNAKRIYKMY